MVFFILSLILALFITFAAAVSYAPVTLPVVTLVALGWGLVVLAAVNKWGVPTIRFRS